ncbi:MAG TPA: septum formation protein Maf [Candidatus Omnitrophica bacterium]|nr:septum formation protein Maf [Candidatus Omnitrophota bacterium]
MLILASRSKARKRILKDLGLKFKVMPSSAEEHKGLDTHPARTVKYNALLKARQVAGRIKDGIVIGCDTLVWQNGRVFGKPKDLKDARTMLKKLSASPHRLYTGIAVIDVKRRKEVVDIEETKIFMERLSDREISNYFKRVSPLDKAGGFDIQGLGGLFIKRIEGCYFNVVGLPVSKLFVCLKKIGASLLMLFCAVTFYGCSTEYNIASNSQDWMMYSTEKEVAMGDSLSKQVEKEYKVVHDPEANERLRRIGEKIASVCDRKELLYRFRIIEDEKEKDMVNAVSLPGGYVYVYKELMKVADSDDELAAVLGHEVAHIAARHSIKRLQAIWGYNILSVLAAGTRNPDFAHGAQAAYLSILSGYSQEDELLADKLGARYTRRAGYDPGAMLSFLEKLRKRHKKEKPRALSYFKTHPFISERIKVTKEELGEKISFEDFININ